MTPETDARILLDESTSLSDTKYDVYLIFDAFFFCFHFFMGRSHCKEWAITKLFTGQIN